MVNTHLHLSLKQGNLFKQPKAVRFAVDNTSTLWLKFNDYFSFDQFLFVLYFMYLKLYFYTVCRRRKLWIYIQWILFIKRKNYDEQPKNLHSYYNCNHILGTNCNHNISFHLIRKILNDFTFIQMLSTKTCVPNFRL